MAKRRFRRYRPDRRRNRKRVPPPTDGWLMPELCRLTRVSAGTVKRYIKLGLLAHPVFRGRATRYDRNTLLRLVAIHQLKLHGYTALPTLRRALDHVVTLGLERWVTCQPMPLGIGEVLSQTATKTTPAQTNAALPEHRPSTTAESTAPDGQTVRNSVGYNTEPHGERWETVVLLPGLELRLDVGKGEELRKIADSLCERVTSMAAASATSTPHSRTMS